MGDGLKGIFVVSRAALGIVVCYLLPFKEAIFPILVNRMQYNTAGVLARNAI